MAIIRLKWSNLLKLTELEFIPDFPAQLNISDEVLQTISWLTGTTGYDRRLLRCTPQGALLVAKPWSMMHVVANVELYPEQNSPAVATALAANKGILISTSTVIVLISFRRVDGGAYEHIYVPPNSYYWYPYSCFTVIATLVPASSATASYVGLTTFN